MPAAETCDAVVPPPTNSSLTEPVATEPLFADFDEPAADFATSNGAVGSNPPYSRIRTSGNGTDWLNVTVTWFAPGRRRVHVRRVIDRLTQTRAPRHRRRDLIVVPGGIETDVIVDVASRQPTITTFVSDADCADAYDTLTD